MISHEKTIVIQKISINTFSSNTKTRTMAIFKERTSMMLNEQELIKNYVEVLTKYQVKVNFIQNVTKRADKVLNNNLVCAVQKII